MHFYLKLLVEFASEVVSGALSLFLIARAACNVATVCSDIAYLFVRVSTPDYLVWHLSSAYRWFWAWIIVWIMQVPLWRYALQKHSLLLVFQFTSVLLTAHHAFLKRCFPPLQSPSVMLAMFGQPWSYGDMSEEEIIESHCFASLGYVLVKGPPDDSVLALCFFLLEVLPVVYSGFKHDWTSPLDRFRRPPWQLSYPPAHPLLPGCSAGTILQATIFREEHECEDHDACPICLSNMCCPGGGAARAGISLAIQRRMVPAISAARQQARKVGSASLAALRSPAAWAGGRIATTRCGHSFHAACLEASVAETRMPGDLGGEMAFEAPLLPQPLRALRALRAARCPQCRRALASPEYFGDRAEFPDEEQMEAAYLVFFGGVFIGMMILLVLCSVQLALGDRAPLMSTIRGFPQDAANTMRDLVKRLEERTLSEPPKSYTHVICSISMIPFLFVQ